MTGHTGEELRKWDEAVQRAHDEIQRIGEPARDWLAARWNALLCDCGKVMGHSKCEHCHRRPSRPAEVRLTEAQVVVFALEERL